MDGLTEGRIVHFVMPNGDHRPAIVVRVWGTAVNLQVFTDGTNDCRAENVAALDANQIRAGVLWITSAPFDVTGQRDARTWHWIERA